MDLKRPGTCLDRCVAGGVALVFAVGLLAGCRGGSTGFDYHELSFRDSIRAEAAGSRLVVVLEQLRDGPEWKYADVPYDVVGIGEPSDSILLILDVEGVSARRDPIVFIQTRQREDTLFVWYADVAREHVAPASGKTAGTERIGTSPIEEYLKVTHVTIRTGADKEVEFLHEFLP